MILAEQLCKDYGPVKAVIDLDFHVNRGEILGILGPNGAGKTTTLRMLTGFLPPTSGIVRIDGIEMAEAPLEAKKKIGYLPESSPLVPEMLTFDYLYHIARLRDLHKEEILPRILQLADECGIRNVMHRPIGALSKGYRQRVGVSAALLSDPGALVLDEPTSGLDPIQIIEFHKLLRQLGEQKAIIFSTHILSEAEAVCDRVIIVNQGRLAAQKLTKTQEGIQEPAQELQLLLTGGTEEEYREKFSSLQGITVRTVHRERDNLCRINLYEEGDQRRTIYQTVKAEKHWDLLELSRQQKSLESLFREITREENHED